MTAQFDDLFHLDGVDYSLAGISEGALFDPSLLGIKPIGTCTACYRGYIAVFGLAENRLVLKNLDVNLDDEGSEGARGPAINGVFPKRRVASGEVDFDEDEVDEELDLFNNHYTNINYHLEYSGGLLLADGFIEKLYIHMGFHPAWKYKTVRELIFENGRLISNSDRSEQMAELRQSFLVANDAVDSSKRPSKKEIERFIESAFDRTYHM